MKIHIVILVILFAVIGCKQTAKLQSPPDYDLSKPAVFKIPEELNEISGIAFKSGNADIVYAEQDEEGKLFYLHPGDSEAKHIKFWKKGDYEDVSVCNGFVIMLRSDGSFFTFLLDEKEKKEATGVKEFEGLIPASEYEAMYADEKTNTVYVLCKNCSDEKMSGIINGYILKIDTAGNMTATGNFSISEEAVQKVSGGNAVKLKASAIAKNELTGEWFIISSVNKLLLITDDKWKVKNAYQLLPASVFTQPEGIAFDKTGNLYISNEMGGGQNGTILKFLYTKK